MGLWDNITEFFNRPYLAGLEKFEQKLQDRPTEAALVATGIIAAPAVVSTLSTGAKAVAPVIATGAKAAAPVVGKAAISAIQHPKETLNTAIGASAALFGGSILLSSAKARKSVVQLPGEIAQFGSNIGVAIDNPSISNVAKIAKDSPVLTAVALAGAALIVSKAAGTAATIANTKAVRDNSDLSKNPNSVNTPISGVGSSNPKPLLSSPLIGDNPTAIDLTKAKRQGKTTKHRRRKAKLYKAQLHRCHNYGSASKCYNFY